MAKEAPAARHADGRGRVQLRAVPQQPHGELTRLTVGVAARQKVAAGKEAAHHGRIRRGRQQLFQRRVIHFKPVVRQRQAVQRQRVRIAVSKGESVPEQLVYAGEGVHFIASQALPSKSRARLPVRRSYSASGAAASSPVMAVAQVRMTSVNSGW